MTEHLAPNLSTFWGQIIIDELARGGVRHVCISPGSRSTPLTLAAASHEGLRVHNHIDERSAAFFALGLAKASGNPVALICTSGSAVAHYLPAFIEAFHARHPLIALSADRPVELIGTGAGQTIDQHHILSSHTVAHTHLEDPSLRAQAVRRMRSTVQKMLARALGAPGSPCAPGPVHLNVPFREPLAPVEWRVEEIDAFTKAHPLEALGRPHKAPWRTRHVSTPHASAEVIALITKLFKSAKRPVIVCGPLERAHDEVDRLRDTLRALLDTTGAILFADPVSHARFGFKHEGALTGYDTILRSHALRESTAFAPDLIVRLGAQPTSKVYRFWREAHPEAMEILIDPFAEALDHPQLATHLIASTPSTLLYDLLAVSELAFEIDTAWRDRWIHANDLILGALTHDLHDDVPLWEGQIARAISSAAQDKFDVFAASSMPIRDLESFGAHDGERLEVFANRGANGIDGLIATAAGVSAARGRRCALLIGDVALLHDAGSLLTALRGTHADTPVQLDLFVINNGGGGIFEFLPIARTKSPHFDEHFITPHQADIASLSRAYGATYRKIESLQELKRHLDGELPRPSTNASSVHQVHVAELIVDRAHNVSLHQLLWERASILMESTFAFDDDAPK